MTILQGPLLEQDDWESYAVMVPEEGTKEQEETIEESSKSYFDDVNK